MKKLFLKFRVLSKDEMKRIGGGNASCEDQCDCQGNSGCSSTEYCDVIACNNNTQTQFVCKKKPIQ